MFNIQLTEEQLKLISQALDLYTRMGLGQFKFLTDCTTVNINLIKQIPKDVRILDKFDEKTTELSNLYTGMSGYSSFGLLSSNVYDDCRVAAHIHQAIRHKLWKMEDEATREKYTVSGYPADVIKGLEIKIEEVVEDEEARLKKQG